MVKKQKNLDRTIRTISCPWQQAMCSDIKGFCFAYPKGISEKAPFCSMSHYLVPLPGGIRVSFLCAHQERFCTHINTNIFLFPPYTHKRAGYAHSWKIPLRGIFLLSLKPVLRPLLCQYFVILMAAQCSTRWISRTSSTSPLLMDTRVAFITHTTQWINYTSHLFHTGARFPTLGKEVCRITGYYISQGSPEK